MGHEERPDPAGAEEARSAEINLQESSVLLVSALERAMELERLKQRLEIGDPARDELAREIEDITHELVSRGRYQTRLVRLQERFVNGMPDHRHPSVVLEEWRDAERRLHEARAEVERASDAADRLREEHRRAFERER